MATYAWKIDKLYTKNIVLNNITYTNVILRIEATLIGTSETVGSINVDGSFDLDMDVKHDPSQFLNVNPGLTLCSDYWKRDNPRYQIKHAYNVTVNSSIMAWVAGEHVDIWQKFLTNTDYYMRKYKGIDRFIIHENFTVNTFKDGIVSSVANPYSGGAAIDMYNGIEYVV